MSDAGESSDDGDGDRVEFLYTGQRREEIPREVTHVRVDPSVKWIGERAFKYCEQLEEVKLGEGLEEIGESAFEACKSLKRFRIPSTVKRIGSFAFEECEQLEEVELCEGSEEIGFRAFARCKSLRRVRIPPTIKWIGEYAFSCCEQLEEVDLCEGLEEIGKCTFDGCISLKRVRIPPSVKWIGERAFQWCELLEEVELCEGLEEIGDFAFIGCKPLKRVRIPLTVKIIGGGTFANCEQLEEAELSEGLEEIGKKAFTRCKSLKRVRIPPTVRGIGEETFEECEQLEEVELCEGLEEICDFTFSVCRSLKRVRIPSTVRKIGERAFEECEQLDGVELCEGLEEIGGRAFEKCFSLRNISFPSSLKLVGAHALRGCHDIRKLFGSQNMTLDALRCRLEGLPVHRICYHQPALLIFEQLQNIFDMMSGQVKASTPAASGPAPKKGNEKRAGTWSVSTRKLKVRNHRIGGSNVASGSATAGGESNFPIKIPNEIDEDQDCLGMTPLHILACSTKQNLDLYRLIIANQSEWLITKDRWGCYPIFYAIRGSCSPEILQCLIDSQKSAFPDIDLNWDAMVSTLCRAGAPLNPVQRLLKIKQAFFPEQSMNFQKATQELTINCLVRCDSFDEDFPSRWEFMMEVFSEYRAQQGLVESLLEIQQSFLPARSSTLWQALCEELVKPLKGWWNPERTDISFSMFQFLVRCSIPERLYAIRVRKWQKDIECLVERNSSLPTLLNHTDTTDTIHSMLVFYECEYDQLKEKAYLIELVLWKSKLDELIAIQHDNAGPSNAPDELTSDARTQCRINCGAEIIIPNVLPYLIADAAKENVSGAVGDMTKTAVVRRKLLWIAIMKMIMVVVAVMAVMVGHDKLCGMDGNNMLFR